MSKDVLRVRATGQGLVQDYERLESGTNAFIGRKFVERKDKPGQYAFEATGEVAEVPYRVEYVKALQTGDLEPADEETAKLAAVKFTGASATSSPTEPAPAAENRQAVDVETAHDAQKGDR